MIIQAIVFISILFTLSGCGHYSHEVIGANDNGLGQSINLNVKASADGTSVLTDTNNNIVLKWKNTGLTVSSFFAGTQGISIGLSIVGRWYPFGSAGSNTECAFISCDKTLDTRCKNLPPDTQIVRQDNNQGCALSNGKGIYMLIAKQINGTALDPNMNATVANSPSSADGFYTAHLGDFTINQDNLMIIDKMWDCDNSTGTVLCTAVPLSELVGGSIYLKVYDGYYGDNSADFSDSTGDYVLLNIQTGVTYASFISEAITIILTTIDSAAQSMNQSVVKSLKSLAFVFIILYVAVTGFMFMTGLSKITQKEAVVRLLKISIVLMFLTPNNSIAEEFPKIYQWLANLSSKIIMNNMNTSIPVIDTDKSIGQLENNLDYLIFYDSIMNQLLSRQVNLKIVALLFTRYFYMFTFMYALIVIIIYVILQSMLLYITAYMQIAILTVILPILIPTLLFETTAELFQNWLKYMANAAFMIVVASAGMGIILTIMISDFSGLVSYSITKNWWWFPDSHQAVGNVLNFKTYMSTLMHVFICYSFIAYVPKLADALSNSQQGSMSSQAFFALSQRLGNTADKIVGKLKKYNNKYLIGRLMDRSYNTDGKYDPSKEDKGILNKWRQTRQDIKNNQFVRLLRATYTNAATLQNDKNQYDYKLKADLNKQYQEKSTEYEKIIETKKQEYAKAIENNLNSIKEVTIDGTKYNLNTNNDPNIIIGNKECSKEAIRKAAAGNKPIYGKTVQPTAYPKNLRNSYEEATKAIKELNKLEKELKTVKRGP